MSSHTGAVPKPRGLCCHLLGPVKNQTLQRGECGKPTGDDRTAVGWSRCLPSAPGDRFLGTVWC